MTPTPAIAAALENALNLYLKQDPDALRDCTDLQGKAIAIKLTGTELKLYFLPDTHGVQVLNQYEGDIDTQLSGTPLGFARLAMDKREDALFQGAVKIEGDTETGQAFQDLLSGIDWDWEEQLSKVTGDVVAHQVGKYSRQAQRLVKDSIDTFSQNSSEYLQEEARLLPTQVEMDYFLTDVDQLRSDADRLEARIKRLQQSMDNLK